MSFIISIFNLLHFAQAHGKAATLLWDKINYSFMDQTCKVPRLVELLLN